MPVMLATQETEIRRIEVGGQPGQMVLETLSRKKPSHKRAGGVAQGVGPEFKPQYHKKKKKKEEEEEKRIGRTEWCNACEVLVAEHTTQGSNGERTDLNGSTAS
jgi:hypothetical protein